MKLLTDADDVPHTRMRLRDFEEVRRLAYNSFGLELKTGKEELVSSRLGKLVRAGRYGSFRDYCDAVRSDATGQALAAMIDALATNHTAFLREPEHFRFLREHVVPKLMSRSSIEVWSAACSTGEEPWTLAFLFNEACPNKNIRILATDISCRALRAAQQATYSTERCRALPPAWVSRFFSAEGSPPHSYQVRGAVRRQVTFRRLNLIEEISGIRPVPVIFCRNVMIYFDRQTQASVIRRLVECLEPGGYLFVGHAESLTRISHGLEYVQPAVYRKPIVREGKWNGS